jgi:hypothetical protein
MKPVCAALLLFLTSHLIAQTSKIDKEQFFSEEKPLNVTLSMDVQKLIGKKLKEGYVFPALFQVRLGDSAEVKEQITVTVRGHLRREVCYLPPLKLNFNSGGSPVMAPLRSLKLVNTCNNSQKCDEYLLKEFLIYKIYNLLTEKSLRVRLLNISYVDNSGRKKTMSGHAFLVEDVKDMAKRNNCLEAKRHIGHTEAADRAQMTMVAIFEYMIGNTDWSVPVKHNIKLIAPKEDTNSRCYTVPYDFDYAGLVDADYAIPDPNLPISNVKERVYRGFTRTTDEIEEVLEQFRKKKEDIYATIKRFDLLPPRSRKEMTDFLDDFFDLFDKPSSIKAVFIQNARKE